MPLDLTWKFYHQLLDSQASTFSGLQVEDGGIFLMPIGSVSLEDLD
jgi:hypothetical protein